MFALILSHIDTYVFEQLWRMLKKRHPNKSKKWLFKKYWTNTPRKHIFSIKEKTKKGLDKVYKVVRIASIGIKRHIKIKAAANPYLPEYAAYFWKRRNKKKCKLLPIFWTREFNALYSTGSGLTVLPGQDSI